MAVQSEALESALWAALRGLEENAALTQRIAARTRTHRLDLAADKLEQQAKKAKEQAALIRDVLLSNKITSVSAESENQGGGNGQPAAEGVGFEPTRAR